MTTNDIDAKVSIYSRAVADLTSERDEYRDDTVALTTELSNVTAELAKVRDQLTAANHRADGLAADVRSLTQGHTAYANENARLRTALIDVAKASGRTHVWDDQGKDWVPVTKFAASKAEVAR